MLLGCRWPRARTSCGRAQVATRAFAARQIFLANVRPAGLWTTPGNNTSQPSLDVSAVQDHIPTWPLALKKPIKGNSDSERQIVCSNRRARHDYDVLDEMDCGIVLTGSEVKSIRNHKITIEEAHARVENGEVWLVDCDIAEYAEASIYNHARQRTRKLLLHRREIRKFAETGENDGLTLIPLSVFFQRGFVKLRLGLCKGRKQHDKRQRLKEADDRREMRSARMKFTGGSGRGKGR